MRFAAIVGFRDVADHGDRPHAERLDLGTHCVQLGLGPGGERQIDTFLGESSGDVHTDAA